MESGHLVGRISSCNSHSPVWPLLLSRLSEEHVFPSFLASRVHQGFDGGLRELSPLPIPIGLADFKVPVSGEVVLIQAHLGPALSSYSHPVGCQLIPADKV